MRSLTPGEVWEFFDSKPGWAALSSVGSDGYPHTVAIGYFRLDEVLYCGCRDNTRKIHNIDSNPRVSLLLENGRANPGVLKGVMFQGDAMVIRDREGLLAIKSDLARRRGEPPPESVGEGVAYIRLVVARTTSWTNQ